ncbi:histidinol-phosphate aminotransferase [Acaromyces ingoldii]|uniref:histidinol-phosphate transaminase n=1 Tax=Acaromyces ingoldii TaxID=215250 RepID=A0A316YKW5_9BASI|nr:histidinol-phosphate aminotransferase [Acaromyces ingoldii]PWN88693.1 histidinol-phosphate aminotransferase [Acaromyces ingoldii]
MTTVNGVSASDAATVASLKPAHFHLEQVIRPNILSLKPYRCARDDYQEGILLDANENSLGHSVPTGSAAAAASHGDASELLDHALPLHRYPDPSLYGIKPTLAKLRGLPSESHVFLGVGSDEVLDLIQRVSCRPQKDKILICPPTYGMYGVCAAVNDLEVVEVPLKTEGGAFSLDVEKVLATLAADPSIKLVFLCSPGNPTGTLLDLGDMERILNFEQWHGLVVVDEAYIDFAEEEIRMGKRTQAVSAVELTKSYKNVVVTQTLSKAYGLAAIRLGIAYAQPALVQILNNTKAPYNIGVPTAHLASLALTAEGLSKMRENVRTLISHRAWLVAALNDLREKEGIRAVGPILGANEANFVLVQLLDDAGRPSGPLSGTVYKRMAEERQVVVRNRSKDLGCDGCLRITVGTEEENLRVIELMRQLLSDGKWS